MSENLTWVIGEYRVYVAEEVSHDLWQCSVRHQRDGWDVLSTVVGTREDAIVHLLNLVEQIDKREYKHEYRLIVNTHPVEMQFKPQTPITAVVAEALRQQGYEWDSLARWSVLDPRGLTVDWSHPIHIYDGVDLVITPGPGIEA